MKERRPPREEEGRQGREVRNPFRSRRVPPARKARSPSGRSGPFGLGLRLLEDHRRRLVRDVELHARLAHGDRAREIPAMPSAVGVPRLARDRELAAFGLRLAGSAFSAPSSSIIAASTVNTPPSTMSGPTQSTEPVTSVIMFPSSSSPVFVVMRDTLSTTMPLLPCGGLAGDDLKGDAHAFLVGLAEGGGPDPHLGFFPFRPLRHSLRRSRPAGRATRGQSYASSSAYILRCAVGFPREPRRRLFPPVPFRARATLPRRPKVGGPGRAIPARARN